VLLTGARYSITAGAESAFAAYLPQATGLYKDKDGQWISAYAPLKSSQLSAGKFIIEINYKIDSYIDKLREELWIIFLVCLAGLYTCRRPVVSTHK